MCVSGVLSSCIKAVPKVGLTKSTVVTCGWRSGDFSCRLLGDREGDGQHLIVSVLSAELILMASVSPWSSTSCYLIVTVDEWQALTNVGGRGQRECVNRGIAFTRCVSEEISKRRNGKRRQRGSVLLSTGLSPHCELSEQSAAGLPPSLPTSCLSWAASGSGPCSRHRGKRSWRKQPKSPLPSSCTLSSQAALPDGAIIP